MTLGLCVEWYLILFSSVSIKYILISQHRYSLYMNVYKKSPSCTLRSVYITLIDQLLGGSEDDKLLRYTKIS